MPNFKLTFEYNGERFSGSQIQNRAVSFRRTVQDELEKALTVYFRSEERILTNFSSRTDAGVHALGQVLNFKVPSFDLSNPEKFLIGLNGILPCDIAVVKAELVPDDFDARFSATAREYMYKIFTRRHRPVLRLDSLLWVKEPLDFNAMQSYAEKFLGEHDFSNYYRSEIYAKNPICNVSKSELVQEGKYCFKYYISANRFLRNMVRRIVAELIEVGKHSARGLDTSSFKPNFKECPEGADDAFVLGGAKTASASALTLLRVSYS